MISRMRVLSFPRTVACAEKVVSATVDTYFAPNKTMRELHELMKSGAAAIDPLKDFSEAARGAAGVSIAVGKRRLSTGFCGVPPQFLQKSE